ncbi:MAG: endonuclease/exonuclease/phosphatase family protein [Actinomycetota bacterium]|jgi:endonuclease/exonuclease/phosphatase (EEP) superfamily protein YafD|nr:endonuclease/exonuclease/phosphatase family protein [Actinomycetota bacterium]
MVLRMVAWDVASPLVIANALTPELYLPAWVVAAVALARRHRALGVAALVVVAGQVALMVPEITAAGPVPAWAAHAPTLRVLDANVYQGNPSMAGYGRAIAADHPDLVTLQEASAGDLAQLRRSGALARLPHRVELASGGSAAMVVASRYPLGPTTVRTMYGDPYVVETSVLLPSGTMDLWVVHTVAPLPSTWRTWSDELASLQRLLADRLHPVTGQGAAAGQAATSGSTGTPRSTGTSGSTRSTGQGARGEQQAGRLLVVGDFNATWQNKWFRRLLAGGLVDGAAARAHAFDMTWSQTMPVLPPLVRIDHVLTSAGLTVTRISTGAGPGSDHRLLRATVAVRPAG